MIQPTTSYKFGDVVLVGFPFTSLKTIKKRPAVILSSTSYQTYRPDVILLAITSQIRDPLTYGEALIADWKQAGLIKPSVFKPLIATVDQEIVLKKMGSLGVSDQLILKELLQSVLDLA
ncbi:type II toxin-antitoxin system PemK/MazF family toxin [Marinobacter sp. 1-3A]|uniref:type II toxin-antitoxin system PemK/MazF family toxin n=1 Tax=Marinobacter sp. 1-3A TaxID=2582920 RepID=UPI0019044D1E|nr:type II toxin-antitoxin system PemK/MazF family toxin [Marinobacter sp. 1-3A]MBK1872154.1 type II toxin-antitoxin system PemK/MazF family toxin [Marinobacter sp. 1-3A]